MWKMVILCLHVLIISFMHVLEIEKGIKWSLKPFILWFLAQSEELVKNAHTQYAWHYNSYNLDTMLLNLSCMIVTVLVNVSYLHILFYYKCVGSCISMDIIWHCRAVSSCPGTWLLLCCDCAWRGDYWSCCSASLPRHASYWESVSVWSSLSPSDRDFGAQRPSKQSRMDQSIRWDLI